jgi:hypothetical protein
MNVITIKNIRFRNHTEFQILPFLCCIFSGPASGLIRGADGFFETKSQLEGSVGTDIFWVSVHKYKCFLNLTLISLQVLTNDFGL